MLSPKQIKLAKYILSQKGIKHLDWRWSLSGKSRSCFIRLDWVDQNIPRYRTTTIFSTSNDNKFREMYSELQDLLGETR